MKKLLSIIFFALVLSAAVIANPVLNPVGDKAVNENSLLGFTLTSTDADNGNKEFYMVNAPAGATLNNQTGEFTWTPGYDTVTTVEGTKDFNVTFGVKDANSTTNETITITVTNVNRAPVASSATLTPDPGYAGSTFTCVGTASDPDGDSYNVFYQFSVGTNVKQAWSSANTYTCSDASCVAGAVVKCEFKANDGSLDSNIVSKSITLSPPTASLSVEDVSVGGPDQEKSNPDEDEIVKVTKQFKIKNTGSETITGITLSTTASSVYGINFTPNNVSSLSPGEEKIISMDIEIDETTNAFFHNLENPNDHRQYEIGKITATGSSTAGSVTSQGSLKIETENKLEIKKVRVYVNDEESGDTVKNNEDVDNIKPGDKLTIEVIAENNFKSSSNVKIKDVEFKVESDSDLDVDESKELGDIRDADEDSGKISFRVDKDIDEGNYQLKITLYGEDEYGAEHGEQWEITIKVEKEDEDIAIERSELSQDTVSCNRDVSLNVRIENIGSDDSDQIVLTVKSKALGLDYRNLDIDLDSGDDYSKIISFRVPEDAVAGSYYIDIATYFDYNAFEDDDISNYKQIELKVEECKTSTTTGETTTDTTTKKEDKKEEVVVVEQPPAAGVTATTKVKATESSDTYLMLLAAGFIVLVVIVIWLAGKALKK